MSVGTELDQVVDELRAADKLLLTTHENPDGDALGSLLATHMILTLLGKDVLMFMAENEFPLPWEYRDMPFEGVLHHPPDDVDERTVVFLDCGNIDRMPVDFLQQGRLHIVNIDHHHDNTRFGTVNLVDARASCTAEIVFRIARELGVEITTPIADALYVALVTDTGRFMYQNTTPEAHRMAAELLEAGVAPHDVYRRLYEGLPFARLQLLARALSRVQRYDGGALTLTYLTREDYEETHSIETDSEGIVDHVRAVEGTAVGALVRELLSEDRAGVRKVSLRSADGRVDVSRIARNHGGGGHRQAAGFSTELPLEELVESLRREVAEQL
ncbi:MAG: bifunctional oligoribonuclease/PAP phosphatase NrnA [Thermoleophilaceae bacterium]|nr:bifunctional oligoribonuclease/PAP phosphatase NrnA [Thermoleophilaceae bacterium]